MHGMSNVYSDGRSSAHRVSYGTTGRWTGVPAQDDHADASRYHGCSTINDSSTAGVGRAHRQTEFPAHMVMSSQLQQCSWSSSREAFEDTLRSAHPQGYARETGLPDCHRSPILRDQLASSHRTERPAGVAAILAGPVLPRDNRPKPGQQHNIRDGQFVSSLSIGVGTQQMQHHKDMALDHAVSPGCTVPRVARVAHTYLDGADRHVDYQQASHETSSHRHHNGCRSFGAISLHTQESSIMRSRPPAAGNRNHGYGELEVVSSAVRDGNRQSRGHWGTGVDPPGMIYHDGGYVSSSSAPQLGNLGVQDSRTIDEVTASTHTKWCERPASVEAGASSTYDVVLHGRDHINQRFHQRQYQRNPGTYDGLKYVERSNVMPNRVNRSSLHATPAVGSSRSTTMAGNAAAYPVTNISNRLAAGSGYMAEGVEPTSRRPHRAVGQSEVSRDGEWLAGGDRPSMKSHGQHSHSTAGCREMGLGKHGERARQMKNLPHGQWQTGDSKMEESQVDYDCASSAAMKDLHRNEADLYPTAAGERLMGASAIVGGRRGAGMNRLTTRSQHSVEHRAAASSPDMPVFTPAFRGDKVRGSPSLDGRLAAPIPLGLHRMADTLPLSPTPRRADKSNSVSLAVGSTSVGGLQKSPDLRRPNRNAATGNGLTPIGTGRDTPPLTPAVPVAPKNSMEWLQRLQLSRRQLERALIRKDENTPRTSRSNSVSSSEERVNGSKPEGTCPAPDCPGTSNCLPGATPDMLVYEVTFKRATRTFLPADQACELSIRCGDNVKVEADRGEDLGTVFRSLPLSEYLEALYQEKKAKAAKIAENGGGGGGGNRENGSSEKKKRNKAKKNEEDGSGKNTAKSGKEQKQSDPPVEVCPVRSIKRILRPATSKELDRMDEKAQEEAQILRVCQTKVRNRSLPMKIVDAEYQFDRHKLTLFFEAERRIDFRELVRDLFAVYKTRIWMQQVKDKDASAGTASKVEPAPSVASDDTVHGITLISSGTAGDVTPTVMPAHDADHDSGYGSCSDAAGDILDAIHSPGSPTMSIFCNESVEFRLGNLDETSQHGRVGSGGSTGSCDSSLFLPLFDNPTRSESPGPVFSSSDFF